MPARILTLPDSPLSPKSDIYSQHSVVFYRLARSDLQQAPPQRDGDCMGPIVGLQFIHQVLDVEVNRGLRNRQLIRNLLVAIAISNESKNLQLPFRKVVVPQVLGDASRHVGRNMPPAR